MMSWRIGLSLLASAWQNPLLKSWN